MTDLSVVSPEEDCWNESVVAPGHGDQFVGANVVDYHSWVIGLGGMANLKSYGSYIDMEILFITLQSIMNAKLS